MADQRNYAALDWVLGEIEETLNDARQALEAYVENPKDSTQLRFCITHIHQVRGSLQIVEFHGASLLAEEMELLAQALMNQKVSSVSDAQEVLMRALLQLPIYLDHVKVYRDDTARAILPLLNDIRALRKESYLSESNLFSPDLSVLQQMIGSPHPALKDAAKVKGVTSKLREMYQFAAASVLRNIKVRENLEYLEKVFARLVVLTGGTKSAHLWLIASALIEGLKDESIELSIAVKGLMRYLARELRLLSENPPHSFQRSAPEGLVKNLLYYVASSDSKSAKIELVKNRYKLLKSEFGFGDKGHSGNNVSALDPDAVRSVVKALREELKTIKSNLDAALSSQVSPEELADVLPVVKRVADTLAVLGIRELRETMLLQAEALKDLSKRNSLDDSSLVECAEHIIDVDSKLEAISKAVGKHRDLANINERSIEIDEAKLAVLKQCQVGLEKVKEAIIEYISSQWDAEQLNDVDQFLVDIRGGLDMVPLPRAGVIIGQCSKFISEKLIENVEQPTWESLDALADAMASIEYYLERLSNDITEDADSLLEMAEQSIAVLGYGVEPGVQEPQEPVSGEEDAAEQAGAANDHAEQQTVLSSAETASDLVLEPPAPESDIDDEIIEIFVEEAHEVFDTLNEYLPKWIADPSDEESLTIVRRAYHTLKGSGRMVEAMDIGELAWSVENMLNRIIDTTVEYQDAHGQLAEAVTAIIPTMIEAFKGRYQNPKKEKAETLRRWAFSLAEGQIPDDFDLSDTDSTSDSQAPIVEQSTESPTEAAQKTAAEEAEEEDHVLLEIFTSEVETHLATIRQFIAWMDAEAPIYIPPTDDLQRAMHTLKGSARMAQVTPIADIFEVLESFAKEMVTFQVNMTDDVLQLHRDAVIYTEGAMQQIKSREPVHIEKLDQFFARTAELRELCVGHFVRMKEMERDGENPVDPRLLSIFMAETMKLLLDADVIVEDWCNQPEEKHQIPELVQELNTLAEGADQAKLPDMSGLALKLEAMYGLLQDDLSLLGDKARALLIDGHAALLDMVDSVAAGQNVQSPPVELIERLDAYLSELQVPSPIVDGEVDLTETLPEPEVDEIAVADVEENLSFESENVSGSEYEIVYPEPGSEKDIDSEVGDEADEVHHVSSEKDAEHDEVESIVLEAPDSDSVNDTNVVAFDSASQNSSEPDVESSDSVSSEAEDAEPEQVAGAEDEQIAASNYEAEDSDSDEELTLENDDAFADQDSPDTDHQSGLESNLETETETETETEPEELVALDDQLRQIERESEEQSAKPAAATTHEGLLDVIDTESEDFDADIIEVFLEEADELFEQLDGSIDLWESSQDAAALEEMKRALHTFKGGARLSGMPVLGDLIHDYESFLLGLDLDAAETGTFSQVHSYQDRMYKGVSAVKAFLGSGETLAVPDPESNADIPAAPEEDHEPFIPAGYENIPTLTEKTAEAESGDKQAAGEHSNANVLPFVAKQNDAPSEVSTGIAPGQDIGQAAAAKKSGPQEVVRINSDLLEELVNLAGETSISRARLEEQVSEFRNSLDEVDSTIDRLQEQLRRLDIETEAQVLFRQEQMAVHEVSFDPLEMDRYSHLQQLSRSLMESASDLYDLRSDLSDKVKDAETTLLQQSRINTTLQEGLMRSRMVPFSRLVPRLRRIVRQVASELGKKVSFELDNVEGELDRNVLERMLPPFEHMLRNAVDHGIESPEERIAAGKPETGRIVLTLGRVGGNVEIRLADDGRGINMQRVRSKAIERGLMDAEANLSDLDVMQFILHAGFSTAETVTQISGRGVGMDVVNAEIKQLGGDVAINSDWGKGTEFVVHLPFTLSVNRALMVVIGKDHYAIPLSSIEGIVRVSPFELDHYYNHPDSEFEYANEKFKVRYLGSLLYGGLKAKLEGHILPMPVILVRSAQHTMALQVDALMGSREIVVKSLGAQFSTVQGLSGATIMGDGSVVVILDPHAIVRQEIAKSDLLIGAANRAQLELVSESKESDEVETVPTVMVVDDSVTVRKVTTRFLEREGYNVITAKDGVDALGILQDEIPDLMLLDIEMPRMDGFEVAKNVRTTQRWKHLPIIMITSRTGDKHREHAFSLGVDRYMGKPYQEDALLESIKELTNESSRS